MNRRRPSRPTKLKPQVQGNGTEMYVLPPHILEKLGINLAQVKNDQPNTSNKCTALADLNSNSNAVEDATSFKKPKKSLKKSSKSTKHSSIMETASLMKKSVFLSPTFLSSDINGQLEIANSRGNKADLVESPESVFGKQEMIEASKLSCKSELISLNPLLANNIKIVSMNDADKEVEHDNEELVPSPVTNDDESYLSDSSKSGIVITTQSAINSATVSNAEKKKKVNILAEEIIAPSRFSEIISKSILSPRREAFIPLTINAIVSVHSKHRTSDEPVIHNALSTDSNNSMVCNTVKVSEDTENLTKVVSSHVSNQNTDEVFFDKIVTEVSSIDDIEVNMLDVSDDIEIPQGKIKLPSLFKNGQYNHISDHNNENNINEESYSTDLITISDILVENISLTASKEFDFQLYQSHNNNFLDVASNVLIEVIDEKIKTDLIEDTQIVTEITPFLSNLSVNESDFNFTHLTDVKENNDINQLNHANSSKDDSSIILQSEKTNVSKSDDTCALVSSDIQIEESSGIINQGNNHVECNEVHLLPINTDQQQDKEGINENPIQDKKSEPPLEESRNNNLVPDNNNQFEKITPVFGEKSRYCNVNQSPEHQQSLSHNEPVNLDKSEVYEYIMKRKEKEALDKNAVPQMGIKSRRNENIKNCRDKVETLNRKSDNSHIGSSLRCEPVNFNKIKVCKSIMKVKSKEVMDKNTEPLMGIKSPGYENIGISCDKIETLKRKSDHSNIESSSHNEPVNFNKTMVCESIMKGKDKEILNKNADPQIGITSPRYEKNENSSDKMDNLNISDNSGKANTAIEEIAYYLSKFTHLLGKRKKDIHIKHRNSKILKCVRNKVRKPKSSIQGIEKPGGSQPTSTEEKEMTFDISKPIKTYKKAKTQNFINKKLFNSILPSNKTIVYDNGIDLNSEEMAGDSRTIQFCICNDYGCLNYEINLDEYYEHIHFHQKDTVISPNDLISEINYIEYIERRLESELLLAEEEDLDQDPTNICWSREDFNLNQKSVENKICHEGEFPHSMDILETDPAENLQSEKNITVYEVLEESQQVKSKQTAILKPETSIDFDRNNKSLENNENTIAKEPHKGQRPRVDTTKNIRSFPGSRGDTSLSELSEKAVNFSKHASIDGAGFISDSAIDKQPLELTSNKRLRRKSKLYIENKSHLSSGNTDLKDKVNSDELKLEKDKVSPALNTSDRPRNNKDDPLIKTTNERPSRTSKVNTDNTTKCTRNPKLNDKTLISKEDKLVEPKDDPLTTNTNERFKRKPKVDTELIATKKTRSYKVIIEEVNSISGDKAVISQKDTSNKTNPNIEKEGGVSQTHKINERPKKKFNIDSGQNSTKSTMPSNKEKELSMEPTGNVELKRYNMNENIDRQTQLPEERPKRMSRIETEHISARNAINTKAIDKTKTLNSKEETSKISKTDVEIDHKINTPTQSINERPRRKSKIDTEQAATKITRYSNPINKTENSEENTLKTKTDVGITNDNINEINNTETQLTKERPRRKSKIDTEQTATKITRHSNPIYKTVCSQDDTLKTAKTDMSITNDGTNERNNMQTQLSNERPRRKSKLEATQVTLTTVITKKKSLGSPIPTKDLNSATESPIARRSQSNNNPDGIKIDANTKAKNIELTEGVIPPRRKSQRGLSLVDGGSNVDTPDQKKRKRSSLDNITSDHTTSKIKHQSNISDNELLEKYDSPRQRANRAKEIQSSDDQKDNSDIDDVVLHETKSNSLQQKSQNLNQFSIKTRADDKMKDENPELTEEKSETISNTGPVGKKSEKASKPKEIAQKQHDLNITTLEANEHTANFNKSEQETGHIVLNTLETTPDMSGTDISLSNEIVQSNEMVVGDNESPPGMKNRKSRGRSNNSITLKNDLQIHDKNAENGETVTETNETVTETNETVTETNKTLKEFSKILKETSETSTKSSEIFTKSSETFTKTSKTLTTTNESLIKTSETLTKTVKTLTETDESITGTEMSKSILETTESNDEIIKMNKIDDNEPPNKIKRKRGRPSRSDMAKKNKTQTNETATVLRRGKKRKLSSASERSNTDTADFDNTSMISMPEMDSSSVNESDYVLKHDLNSTINEYTMDEVTINRTIDSLRSSMTTDLQETITSSIWDSSTAVSSQTNRDKMSMNKSGMRDAVECGVCNEVVKETDWIEHICIVHKYLAWKRDEEPIPLTNSEAVFQHLNALSKELGGLKCRHCGVRKKYVKTFNKHVDQCVLDNSFVPLNTSEAYNTSNISQMDTTLDDSQLDLTSSAKCAVCRTVVDRAKWISHIEERHNYLAWEFEDQNPPDFKKREDLVGHLERICEGNGGLKCGKCSELFKKVPKYLEHTETCSSSETENDTPLSVVKKIKDHSDSPLSVIKNMKDQLDPVRDNDSNSLNCAVCSEEVSRKKWQNHAMEAHYNIAWPVGAEPIDIKNPYVIIKHMTPYKKKYGDLICNICKTTRASILGFYAHILTCGKTKKEIDEVMEKCETCSCTYLVIYRVQHHRDHRRKREEEERRRRALDEQASREAEASQPPELTGRRRAAVKALSVLKSIQDEGKKDVESATPTKPEDDFVEYSSSEESAELSSESDITEESSGSEDELGEGEEDEEEGLEAGKPGTRDRRAAFNPEVFAASQRAVKKAADEFFAVHFTKGPLFPHWRHSDCLQLCPDEVPRYQQLLNESCKVRFSKHSGWRTYKPLEATVSTVRSIYLGAAPSCISWADAGADGGGTARGGGRSYLAVALHRGADCPRLQFDRAHSHPNIIQLWDFGNFQNYKPQLVMGIAHNYGTVWSMSWCPSGARDLDDDHTVDTPENDISMCDTPKENRTMCNTPTEDRSMCNTPTEFQSAGDTPMDVSSGGDTPADNKSDRGTPGKVRNPICGRLGLLALACSDGVVYVLSVPYPDTLCSNGTYYCKLKPVAELRLHSNKRQLDYQATSIFWSLEKGHTTITASYSNGVVAHYDLSTDSELLTSLQDGVQVFHPYHDEKIHATCVTGISCHPSSPGAGVCALASSSVTGSVLSLRAGGGGGGGGALLCRLATSAHVHQIEFAPHSLNIIKVSEDPKLNELSLEPCWRLERRVLVEGRAAGCARCGVVAAFSPPYLHLCNPHPEHLHLHKRKIAAIEMIPLDAKMTKVKPKSPLEVTLEPATYDDAVQRYGLDFCVLTKAQVSKGIHKHKPFMAGPVPERFPLADVSALAFCPSRSHHDRLAIATHAGFLFVLKT